jgi:D-3-phosphoglycerate dehydrogenase
MDGKTLGLIGCGNIGRNVADKCRKAFNMKVIGYDPYLKQAPKAIELYPTVRISAATRLYSLHIPFTPETKNTN